MRTRNRQTRRRVRAASPRGGFLLVTLVQCVLCTLILTLAYFISGLFEMTQLKPAVAALLTDNAAGERVDGRELFEAVQNFDPSSLFVNGIVSSSLMHTPVEGVVTSGYGFRSDPISGKRDFHTGVDLAAEQGSLIFAAYPGVVETVGVSVIDGNYIVLRHGNFATRYCHCLYVLPQEGDFVAAGEAIALVGATGRATGEHLHFEMLVDDTTVDPTIPLGEAMWL